MVAEGVGDLSDIMRVDNVFFDGFYRECLGPLLWSLKYKVTKEYPARVQLYVLSMLFKLIENGIWSVYLMIIIFGEDRQDI